MRLYHGTNVVFDEIDLTKSKPNKDFGQGFYLSASKTQAAEMAKARVKVMGGEPHILEFEFDEDLLTSDQLKVLTFDNYSEEWANFILANRNNKKGIPVHDNDIVVGPIANDRVGLQLWRFENNDIDMATLIRKLRYMKGVTIQYYFGTERAIQYLKRL
jgi:hypothetical protein